MDRNQQADAYLALLAPEPLARAEGLAFRSQLQRIRFDHSLASLTQIDEVLAALRATMKLDYGAFLERQPAVNFVVALNFYLGATIARVGHFAIKWIDHAQAAQYISDLPTRMETDVGCVLGDLVLFPASVVTEMLFDPSPQRTCSGFAAATIERLAAAGQRLPDPLVRPAGEPDPAVTGGLQDALGGAGFLGAWGMAEIASGAALVPVALLPEGAQRTLLDFSTFGHAHAQDAIQDGMSRLRFNPTGAPWQALCYDGYVNLPTGRRDALVVELRLYEPPVAASSLLVGDAAGGGQPVPTEAKTALELTMALPYRPPGHPLGFANFAPRMVGCSYRGPELAGMLDAFYRGIYSAQHFAWQDRYEEG